jgi:hypothetical protein
MTEVQNYLGRMQFYLIYSISIINFKKLKNKLKNLLININ